MTVEQMGNLIDLVQQKQVTGDVVICIINLSSDMVLHLGTSGKLILRHILETKTDLMSLEIARELGLLVASDDDAALRTWCMDAIKALPEEAQRVRDGNKNVINRLLGHVMKTSRGRADAKAAKALLVQLLVSR